MMVLGIDPGIHIVGYAIVESEDRRQDIIDYGVIRTASDLPQSARLNIIAEDLEVLCAKYHPSVCAIERLYFARNVKTALSVSEARGVIVQTLHSAGLEIHEYTPLQVKISITGYGNAAKVQIQRCLQMIFKLPGIPYPDDAADALAVAICHLNTQTFQKTFNV